MSTVNLKRVDISAYTREEAEELLAEKMSIDVDVNATQAWKNAGSPVQNTPEFKEFVSNYFETKIKKAGRGFVIIYEPGSADTRTRPYTVDDVVNEKGKRKFKMTYVLVDKATGQILLKNQESKAAAKEAAKELFKSGKFKGKASCYYSKEVVEGEPLAFEIAYEPSKNARKGVYLFFGVEK